MEEAMDEQEQVSKRPTRFAEKRLSDLFGEARTDFDAENVDITIKISGHPAKRTVVSIQSSNFPGDTEDKIVPCFLDALVYVEAWVGQLATDHARDIIGLAFEGKLR